MNSAKFSFTLGESFLAKLVSKLKFQTVRSPFACGKIQPQSRLSKIERPNEQSDKFRQYWSIGVYWRYHPYCSYSRSPADIRVISPDECREACVTL